MTGTMAIVPTGTANMASVVAAFRRLGAYPRITARPDDVDSCDRVVVPGVGSFGAAVSEIERAGLRDVLRQRVSDGRPTLAICVGMQLLASRSEESPGSEGLGLFGVTVGRYPDDVRVPQLGWNQVVAGPDNRLVSDGWAYFANSFRVEAVPQGWAAATADHGGPFVAAVERGDVLACQFHPELSGEWGRRLLSGWLGTGRSV